MWRTLVVLLIWQATACACLNDRDSDTLAEEAKGLPDVVQVITGRFPRNPPLFYEMRIRRVAAELATDPTKLGLYDDIAVAYDRLGQDDAAIAWIKKKRQRLDPLNIKAPSVHEHWYRYYANLGTFEAHHWLRAGANRKKIDEMQPARDDITHAIHLKPNAHFGREKYQLMAMNWIVAGRSLSFLDHGLPTFMRGHESEFKSVTVEGICGLIVLGNAWESVDIFNALKYQLLHSGQRHHGNASLAYLAELRCDELVDQGKRSLMPGAPTGLKLKELISRPHIAPFTPYSPQQVANAYRALRQEAEKWQQQRTVYMLTRLSMGRHPDTDPAFWREYTDAGPPDLNSFTPLIYRPRIVRDIVSSSTNLMLAVFTFLLTGPFILRALVNRSRRRKAALQP